MEEKRAVFPMDVVSDADVRIITSGGLRIPAHSFVLARASPVLENILIQPRRRCESEDVVPILGVPCNAVIAFVRYLYSSRLLDEDMEKYGIHLLVLSHVYLVTSLKQMCTRRLAEVVNVENVVDILQLARMCDASSLYVRCMKMISKDFKQVEKTEGWKFVQDHDPWLELELLQFIDEAELRQRRRLRNKNHQSIYLQLSEAMDCLQHIFTEGCTDISPCDKEPNKNKPCNNFKTCKNLQLLIRHFATCQKKIRGGCTHCKRMWQLFRLHASICDQPEGDPCRIPICRQFKLQTQLKKKGDDGKWKQLVRKVLSARAISSLSKRKMEEEKVERSLRRHDRLCTRGPIDGRQDKRNTPMPIDCF